MFDKKILCLGNNNSDTDQQVTKLASKDLTVNHGLLTQIQEITKPGYYHTSVADMIPGDIVNLSAQFDQIVLINQPLKQWSHPVLYNKTIHVIEILQQSGAEIIDLNDKKSTTFFQNLLKENKSFCVYPFIHLVSRGDGYTNLCSRSVKPVTELSNMVQWQNNKDYQHIRDSMLRGEKIADYCNYCYDIEKDGGIGARIHETLEWTSKLGIENLDDLQSITDPVYYEVRPSNRCNLMCRSCVPRDSHLIDREFKAMGILGFEKATGAYAQYTGFDIVNLNSVQRLYVAGGEPTVMPELYDFLRKCIAAGRTDFEFMINTNAVKISNRLMQLFKHFDQLGFSVSLDGVGKVNDYIRWPSQFADIVANTHRLIDQGHHVAFITVVSIYNIASLDQIMQFQDTEFPGVPVMLQFDTFKDDIQSPYNHPNTKMISTVLQNCKSTKAYVNYSRGTKSIIDQLYAHYSKNLPCDMLKLKKFYEFNNLLDQSRNHKLEDYIPELSHELLCFHNK